MVEKGEEDAPTVVLDNGSGYMIKAGFGGEDAPLYVSPAIVGRPKKYPPHRMLTMPVATKDEYIGDEAQQNEVLLDISYPIEAGIVQNWEDMQKVWNHIFFNELKINPKEVKGVLLTDSPLVPNIKREKMTQIMFETFEV